MSDGTWINEDARAVICVDEVRVGQGKVSEQAFKDALQSHLAKFDKGTRTSEHSCLSNIEIK